MTNKADLYINRKTMDNKLDRQMSLLFWNLYKSSYPVRLWCSESPTVYALQNIIANIGGLGTRIGLTDLYESENRP